MVKKRRKKPVNPPGSHVKLSFKKHLLPPLAGLAVAIVIFGFFSANLLSGQVAYYLQSRRLSRQPVAGPLNQTSARQDTSQIIIQKINLETPVNFTETRVSQAAFQQDMRQGVVHYPGTALPGEEGNVVIFGHSSDAWWAPGQYKYVFVLLNKLTNDDLVAVDYQGQRYVYRVYNVKLVKPTELKVLNQSSAHDLTLITSAPVGTNSKRLVISARQTVPEALVDIGFNQAASQPPLTTNELPGASGPFWTNFKQLF